MGKTIQNSKLTRRELLFSGGCLLGFMALPFKKAIAGIPSIQGSRIGDYKDKTRFVLDLSKKVDHKIFILENPNRVVIDLPHMEWGLKDSAGKGLIKKYRFGRFNGNTSRLVLDVTDPVIIKDNFILPASANKGPRLVLDLVKSNSIKKIVTPDPEAEEETYAVQPIAKKKFSKKVITLDPGHGGADPGAIGVGGVYEKTLTLKAAKEAKKHLEATGKYKVYLTRKDDRFLKLWQRVDIARKNKSDLFISIHADSLGDKRVKGASIYTLAEKASDARAAKLATKENKADLLFDENLAKQPKEVANILLDLKRRETLNASKIFANGLIVKMKTRGVNLLNKNHRYAAFAVLKAPDVPSVLLEMGFLSNKQEIKLLKSASYRKKICSSIVAGADKHFG
jgi:N-acetylmuramoyl-L-alanine amidase